MCALFFQFKTTQLITQHIQSISASALTYARSLSTKLSSLYIS